MKEEKLIIHPKRPRGMTDIKPFLFASERTLCSALMKYRLRQDVAEMN